MSKNFFLWLWSVRDVLVSTASSFFHFTAFDNEWSMIFCNVSGVVVFYKLVVIAFLSFMFDVSSVLLFLSLTYHLSCLTLPPPHTHILPHPEPCLHIHRHRGRCKQMHMQTRNVEHVLVTLCFSSCKCVCSYYDSHWMSSSFHNVYHIFFCLFRLFR